MFFIWILCSLVFETLGSGVDLECFNDYDRTLDCSFSPGKSNCSEFSMDVKIPEDGPDSAQLSCIFKESKRSSFRCECTVEAIDGFVLVELNTARLWKAGTLISNLTFSTAETIKPRAPATPVVKRTENGNYLVWWKTNYDELTLTDLSSFLTCRKRGEQEGVTWETQSVEYEIPGAFLEPGGVYVVSVRTLSRFSNLLSDSSGEAVLSTPAAPLEILPAVITVICVVVVILTVVLFWSFFRLKDKLWDKIPKYAKPDLLSMLPAEPRILSPPEFIICSIYVDSPQMDLNEGKPWSKCSTEDSGGVTRRSGSGTGRDSSSLGYAHTCPVTREQSNTQGQMVLLVQEALGRVFASLAPADGRPWTPAPPGSSPGADDGCVKMTWPGLDKGHCVSPYEITQSSGSSGFNNMTYLSTQEPVEVSRLPCESAYQPSEGGAVVPLTGPPDLHFSPISAPLVQIDFSYQPCDNICLSATTEEDIASRVMNARLPQGRPGVAVSGYQSFREAVHSRDGDGEAAVCVEDAPSDFAQEVCGKETVVSDANPGSPSVPSPEAPLPLSDGAYQAFQSVLQPRPAWRTPALTG